MSRVNLNDAADINQITEDQTKVEAKSQAVEKVVLGVISVYAQDLDQLVGSIDANIRKQELDGLTDQELETYCLKLSSFMYFAAAGQELIGLKEAIANALNKEEYNNSYANASGTIADKKASAELESQSSMLVDLIYDQAEKMMASKLAYATHLLGSIKRVLNRRIEQMKMNPSGITYKTDTEVSND